jgi:hypothetical protein
MSSSQSLDWLDDDTFFCVAIFMTSVAKYANCILSLLAYLWIAFGAKFVAKTPLLLVFLALLCP